MLKNYFKVAARNLFRHKMFSFINIFGLAIGIAACLLIVQFITFELSYDDFHVKGDQIYRLRLDRTRNGVEDQSAGTAPGLGPALKENFPEVVQYARFKNIDYMNNIVVYGDSKYNQKNICFVDSTFLSIFNFSILKGEVKGALSKPYTALITTSTAKKYFGEEDPVNKVITLSNNYGEQTYEITGIIDSPVNSHLNFDFLLSYESLINLDPFEYFFLDDYFNMQYKSDLQFGKIFILFTSLAILVACMGLFGLVSFNTAQRIKEIGVRKILGASVPAILTLLSKDFIKLILLSVVFAWPIIYLSVHKWLENYSYKVEITGWLFIIPALLVLVIGLATVSVQSIKAALVNPVKSLRSE